ncbi:hypothetical protein RvY_14201 [Ramazzottius varieornatus]|uniref:Uncharacterized protein n=1 Tax=Ramazzottius varieornatus TaxID=947166 RepID=A0A1D1VQH6_RAMVA|nr:hypothetical protein RvY_14201 [Ramazzottius varieornatus]
MKSLSEHPGISEERPEKFLPVQQTRCTQPGYRAGNAAFVRWNRTRPSAATPNNISPHLGPRKVSHSLASVLKPETVFPVCKEFKDGVDLQETRRAM